MAKKIVCPKCNQEFEITISNAVDEDGEVYICPKCHWAIRYVSE